MEDWEAKLAHCVSLEAVKQVFSAAVSKFGYTASACGAFIPADRGPAPIFFFQAWPAGWIELYRSRQFHLADFSVAEARRRIAPFSWLDVKAQRSLSRAENELWETARQ